MMHPKTPEWLQDGLDACNVILEARRGQTRESFLADPLRTAAVERDSALVPSAGAGRGGGGDSRGLVDGRVVPPARTSRRGAHRNAVRSLSPASSKVVFARHPFVVPRRPHP